MDTLTLVGAFNVANVPVITAPSDIVVEATGPAGTPESDSDITTFLVGATATDVEDGVLTADITHDGPLVYPIDDTLVTFSVTDLDGNTTTASAIVTVADGTFPTVIIDTPADGAVYDQNASVFSDFSCDDAGGSGIDTCVGTVDGGSAFNSGSLIDTATLGEHTLTVTATDLAGNVASLDRIYTVTVGTADASTSTITASPSSITADGISTSTVTVQLNDATGNPLVNGGDDVVLITDLGTLSLVSYIGDGTYTATLTSDTAGTAIVTGMLDSLTIGSATVTVVDNAPPVTPPSPAPAPAPTASNDDDDDDDDDPPPAIPASPGPGGSPNDNGDSNNDRDGDGHRNMTEIDAGSNPDDPNSIPNDRDGDSYSNLDELAAGSDPDDPKSTPNDRDGDGFSNDVEMAAGSDPDDPDSTPNNVRPNRVLKN